MADRDIFRDVTFSRERRDDLYEAATVIREFLRQGRTLVPRSEAERLADAIDDTVNEWDAASDTETIRRVEGEPVEAPAEALAWALGVMAP